MFLHHFHEEEKIVTSVGFLGGEIFSKGFHFYRKVIVLIGNKYSRTSVARTLMARLSGLFQSRSRVPKNNRIAAHLE